MNEPFKFYTDSITWHVETKSDGEKKFYVEGYASTSDLDLTKDIVTPEALQDMLLQCKNRSIKVDVEHEIWMPGGSPNIIPIGKIVDARIDEKGLWVKAQLNDAVERFDTVWKTIEKGFLDAFSIAFTNVKAVDRMVSGVKTRFITGLHLLNIAITGNPANPAARFTNVMAKSAEFANAVTTEEPPMVVENETTPVPEPVTEPAPEVKSVTVEDLEALRAEVIALKNLSETHSAQLVEKDAELKSLKEAMSTPILKTNPSNEQSQEHIVKPSIGPLDLFNNR